MQYQSLRANLLAACALSLCLGGTALAQSTEGEAANTEEAAPAAMETVNAAATDEGAAEQASADEEASDEEPTEAASTGDAAEESDDAATASMDAPASSKPAASQAASLDAAYSAATELLPPEAKPGECYARVYIPAVEERVARQVLVKEATEELQVIEAKYETVVERVEVAKEAEKLELIPAIFKTETTTVEVEPEKEVEEIIPAVYEEVTERVKLREAYRTWKKGEGPIQRYDEATGEIMCLVEIPAEYNDVTKRVVKAPPRTVTKVIPAQTKTLEVRVMVQPPKTRTVTIPAKFEEVEVRKLVEPAKIERIEIPARYETVYETVKASEGRMEWRPILCSTNVSEDIISRLQKALTEAGYNVGVIDGVLGQGTMNAVKRYQRENGLAEGQITIETLKSLEVAIR